MHIQGDYTSWFAIYWIHERAIPFLSNSLMLIDHKLSGETPH